MGSRRPGDGAEAGQLNFNEGRVRAFKASLRSIGTSQKFNLDYLRRFVRQRALFRRLFLLVSEKKLPATVQAYTHITQYPHFILNYSSIANLPVVGLSDRFDIFFFSPVQLVPSASALLDQLRALDPQLANHPLKVYEVDPPVGTATRLPVRSHFTQALSYFESNSIDTALMGDLTYDQMIPLLERSGVSLRDLFTELPPGGLTSLASPDERALLSQLAVSLTRSGKGPDMFLLLSKAGQLRAKIRRLKSVSISYSTSEIRDLDSGGLSPARFRKRIGALATELLTNLRAVHEMLL